MTNPHITEDGEVNKSDIKLSGDIAWEETMQEDCDCGAEERRECRCRRTQEFKDRAEKIRMNWFGNQWANPIQNLIEDKERFKS